MKSSSSSFVKRPVRPWVGVALLLAVSLVGAAGSAFLHPGRPEWRVASYEAGAVNLSEARAIADALWIDAREDREYAEGHVPGAVSLNETRWEALLPSFLESWQPGQVLIVYCGSDACPAARQVRARIIREIGLDPSEVHFLRGGLAAWPELQLTR